MTLGPFDITSTGIWECSKHQAAISRCELDGQAWAGCDFPLEVTDFDRVWLDASRGDLRTTWRPDGPGGVVLEVTVRRPVRLAFAVRYRLPEHEPILHDIAYDGYLMLCYRPDPTVPPRLVFWRDGCYSDGLERLLPSKPACVWCSHSWLEHGQFGCFSEFSCWCSQYLGPSHERD
jgi:hypothetical protein